MPVRRWIAVSLFAVLAGCNLPKGAVAMHRPDCTPSSTALPDYQSDASGTVIGDDVNASLCHVWAHAMISPYTTPSGQALLMFDSSTHDTPQAPEGTSGGVLIGQLAIDAPAPGVYRNSDQGSCGGVTYDFQLPLPAGTDCNAGTPPECPQNCTTACSSSGCLPCTPNPPSVDYQAAVVSDCLGSTQSPLGAWQIELTSATPVDGPDAGGDYLVHGSLRADVLSGGSTAVLALSF
jgi:hypothetical protein